LSRQRDCPADDSFANNREVGPTLLPAFPRPQRSRQGVADLSKRSREAPEHPGEAYGALNPVFRGFLACGLLRGQTSAERDRSILRTVNIIDPGNELDNPSTPLLDNGVVARLTKPFVVALGPDAVLEKLTRLRGLGPFSAGCPLYINGLV
jgi:hypothetical protein